MVAMPQWYTSLHGIVSQCTLSRLLIRECRCARDAIRQGYLSAVWDVVRIKEELEGYHAVMSCCVQQSFQR